MADNLAFVCRLSKNSGSLKLLEPSGPAHTYKDSFTFLRLNIYFFHSVSILHCRKLHLLLYFLFFFPSFVSFVHSTSSSHSGK
jgi:hypothetical protein